LSDGRYFADLVDLVKHYDYFLFDCDGVLWHGDSEIKDAFKALRYIKSHPGKEIFLITNNSSRLRETVINDKVKVFGGDGFEVPLTNIYTSAYVTG
jgi:4-nitrophenyl phosphatase